MFVNIALLLGISCDYSIAIKMKSMTIVSFKRHTAFSDAIMRAFNAIKDVSKINHKAEHISDCNISAETEAEAV